MTNENNKMTRWEEELTQCFTEFLNKTPEALEKFLKLVKGTLDTKAGVNLDFSPLPLVEAEVSYKNSRFDMIIKTGDTVLVIENKLGDSLKKSQLKKYKGHLAERYPEMKQVLLLLTRSGVCYDGYEVINELFDGHLYWNDVRVTLESLLPEESKIGRILTSKMYCDPFLDWPKCPKKFEKIADADFKPQAKVYRDALKPKFVEELRKGRFAPDGYSAQFASNSPANTIGFSFSFIPEVALQNPHRWVNRRTCDACLGSLNLWIWFGEKVYDPMKGTVRFERPEVMLGIWFPKSIELLSSRLGGMDFSFLNKDKDCYKDLRKKLENTGLKEPDAKYYNYSPIEFSIPMNKLEARGGNTLDGMFSWLNDNVNILQEKNVLGDIEAFINSQQKNLK